MLVMIILQFVNSAPASFSFYMVKIHMNDSFRIYDAWKTFGSSLQGMFLHRLGLTLIRFYSMHQWQQWRN